MYRKLNVILPLLFLASLFSACSPASNDGDLMFVATEVGTPEGDKVTKKIGPEGGVLASPDGRLTLTVPKDALVETLPFSIQPITNKAGNGIGLAYRLEPSGRTFTTPLEISVRYDDGDLKGTSAEALAIAYQDELGSWRAENLPRLDPVAKTLVISAAHFTDFAFFARLRIRPTSASVYVGESQSVELTVCRAPTAREKRKVDPRDLCSSPPGGNSQVWSLRGAGTLGDFYDGDDMYRGVMYNAPSKKPADNIANVDLEVEFDMRDPETGRTSTAQGTFTTIITILDRGYRATGGNAHMKYSGTICSLEKPFTIIGTYPDFTASFDFVPASATSGTGSYRETPGVQVSTGKGPYTIEGSDTESPKILWSVSMNTTIPGASHSASGTAPIELVSLDTDECN